LTVYPFILRGVTLAGIDATTRVGQSARPVWENLAGPWRIALLESRATTIGLPELDESVQKILRGEIVGRIVVDPNEAEGAR
jgi:acrylyl-CoA reductase (NADPH)